MIHKEERTWEGIPFSLTYERTPARKPVTFFFHGFTSDHKRGVMGRDETLAGMGHVVIAMDAPGHGARDDVRFRGLSNIAMQAKMPLIVEQTCADAGRLYDHLAAEGTIDMEMPLVAYGVSMGGHTAFLWGALSADIDIVVSLVGSPSITDFYRYKQTHYGFGVDDDVRREWIRYTAIDPLLHPAELEDTPVFAATGEKDTTVPDDYVRALTEKIPMTHRSYPVGHTTTPAMLGDAHRFLQDTLDHMR